MLIWRQVAGILPVGSSGAEQLQSAATTAFARDPPRSGTLRMTYAKNPNFASVQQVVEAFEAAAASGDAESAERLLHPVWRSKLAVAQMGRRVVLREAYISNVEGRHAMRPECQLTSIQVCGHDLAVARAENAGETTVALHLLLRDLNGGWRMVGEASASASAGRRSARFENRSAETAVLDVMAEYYRAVTEGDVAAIEKIFAPFWEMKNHENGEIASEDKAAFMRRIESGPLPGYWDDRQIADVQIIYDRLAFVRIDQPSTPSTTVFLLMKLSDHWRVIDKAWVDGRV